MDDELVQFVLPSGNTWLLRLTETEQTLRGSPRSIMRMAVISTLFPWSGVAWMTWLNGPKWCEGFGLPWYVIFSFAVLATCTCLGIIHAINRKMVGEGNWFVLDKVQRTLALPRSGVVLKPQEIRQVIELYGWWRGNEGRERTCEISVLVSDDGGKMHRYPVAQADLTHGPRIAKSLAAILHVPRRTITHPFFGSAPPQITVIDSIAEN